MAFEYRLLMPNESQDYRAIRLESLQKFPAFFGEKYEEALMVPQFQVEKYIETPSFEIFVMGVFCSQKILSGICLFMKKPDNIGYIYQMYVKEALQGQKVGLSLIKATLTEAQDRFSNIVVILEVALGNAKAYHLYQAVGFKDIPDHAGTNTIAMRYDPFV